MKQNPSYSSINPRSEFQSVHVLLTTKSLFSNCQDNMKTGYQYRDVTCLRIPCHFIREIRTTGASKNFIKLAIKQRKYTFFETGLKAMIPKFGRLLHPNQGNHC